MRVAGTYATLWTMIDSPDLPPMLFEISQQEYDNFLRVIGLKQVAPGRVSNQLGLELYAHTFVEGAVQITPKVVAEIEIMEGVREPYGMKAPDRFRHPPLRGLWKGHYLRHAAEAVPSNVLLEHGRIRKVFLSYLKQLRQEYPEDNTPEQAMEYAAKAARQMMSYYDQRKQRGALTGEWIVYVQHEGQNYYLTLAQHDEGDEQIHRRIVENCFQQWPWLSSYLPPVS
ncbi:hypothetical protein D9599_26665 [Roseomonas sp. KE2513]|uniref:hypothetical protein n=1 Tax=Roseomonas sp. KE2513 TaxID=2479202 RepID=UPI0018DFF441|nr:hypothetical protein [Roseomonas sp. KE2513]MBI0539127.1 hypothetical protein [Roseomonas sp. KE2513]